MIEEAMARVGPYRHRKQSKQCHRQSEPLEAEASKYFPLGGVQQNCSTAPDILILFQQLWAVLLVGYVVDARVTLFTLKQEQRFL
jgi:hypothetical protein